MHRFSLVALLALVALASAHHNDLVANNNLQLGFREYGDQLIEQKEVKKHWLPFTVVEKDVTVTGDGHYKITRVEVVDLKNNAEKSAKVELVSGGPGQSFVSLHFKSTRGNGIKHLVKVYGKREL